MTEWIFFGISAFFATVGVAAFISAAVGVIRFDHVLYRFHAAALADTVGITSLALSAMVYIGIDFVTLKELTVILIMLMTSPVSTHLLCEIEYVMGNRKKQSTPQGGKEDGSHDA